MLRVTILDPPGEERFNHLALDRRFFSNNSFLFQVISIPRQLLSDSAGALVTALRVENDRSDNADEVDAVVTEKPRVFARTQSFNENFWYLIDRDDAAILHKNPADLLTITIQNDAWLLKVIDFSQVISCGALTVFSRIAIHENPNCPHQDEAQQKQA